MVLTVPPEGEPRGPCARRRRLRYRKSQTNPRKKETAPGGLFCRLNFYARPRYAKISAALVSGFALGITFSMTPCSSMMKVERTTPMLTLP